MRETRFGDFENYEIPTRKLSMISGGYLIAGDFTSSCSTATGSSSYCDDVAVCNCTCQETEKGSGSAIIETVFNEENTGGLTPLQKQQLYDAAVPSCENQAEIDYIGNLLLGV